jgi:dTDP-L-rhamnose 4-epimerase
VTRVLVTGGAGFIGGHLVETLLDRGDEVRVLDLLLPQAWHQSRPAVDPRAEFVVGDVRDRDTVARCLDGVDAVSHQAAMVGLGLNPDDLPLYAGHNDLGTATVLAAAAAAGVGRVVLASSMVVYGEGRWTCPDHGDVHPLPRHRADLDAGRFDPGCPACGTPLEWGLVDEFAPLDPRSAYAATKVAQEHLAAVWARSTGGSVVALRYHNVYGPRMPRDTPYAGVAAIFRSALERRDAPRVFEDGGQMRDFVHVTDVAAANVAALDATLRPAGGGFTPVNVCSGDPHTVGEMAMAIAAAMGGPAAVVTGEYRLGDVRHVVASPARAEDLLGFRATVRFEDGLADFATAPLR